MPKISNTTLSTTVQANDDLIIVRNNTNSANSMRIKANTMLQLADQRGSANLGIVSSGNVALSANNGPLQHLVCNGAITILAPNSDCQISLMVVNGTNAVSLSFANFTKQLTSDTYDTTVNSAFQVTVKVIKSLSSYKTEAMQ